MTLIHQKYYLSKSKISILSIKTKISISICRKQNINTIYQKQSIVNKTKISILFIKNKVLLKNQKILKVLLKSEALFLKVIIYQE